MFLQQVHNGQVIYTNNVKATKFLQGAISTHFLLEVSCVIRSNAVVETFFEAKEITNTSITGAGRFNPTISFYRSSSFSEPITYFPYQVDFRQEAFVQVQLDRADPSLHLFVDSCVASPNHDFTVDTRDLILNGYSTHHTLLYIQAGPALGIGE